MDPFKSSYQLTHKSLKPETTIEEGCKHIEMSNKRMRESKIFEGKALDCMNNNSTRFDTSYKVVVAIGKQEKATQDMGMILIDDTIF